MKSWYSIQREKFFYTQIDKKSLTCNHFWLKNSLKKGFISQFQSGHTTPLPCPKGCKYFVYGLQHKIAIKRIFTLFLTNMIVAGVWLWRISVCANRIHPSIFWLLMLSWYRVCLKARNVFVPLMQKILHLLKLELLGVPLVHQLLLFHCHFQ